MHRVTTATLLATVILCWASAAAAAPRPAWNEALREHFQYVIKVDGQIVAAAKQAEGLKGVSDDSSGVSVTFTGVIVFSESFEAWLNEGGAATRTLIVGSEKQGEILRATLGDAKVSNVVSKGLVANVEHPATLKYSFTVSPNYVKISA